MEEDSSLDFHFKINLERLCVVKIATSLWEKEEIKQKVFLFFQNNYNRYEEEENSIRWNKLTTKVLSFLKNLSLPLKLNNRMKCITKCIGKQIFNWTKYVTEILELDVNCAQEIFWTYYGTVDKTKIFKNWVEQRKFNSSQLFNMACMFCLEEYIPLLWNEIPDDIKNNDFYSESIYLISKYNIIAYWKTVLAGGVLQNFSLSTVEDERVRLERLRGVRSVENEEFVESMRRKSWFYILPSPYIEEIMFMVSMPEGLELAVKYFWSKLSEKQQRRNVPLSMHILMEKSEEPEYVEILIFLMSKLSVEQNIKLKYEEFFLLEMLLKNWPWEEFFTTVLDRILECYENSTDKSADNYETKFFYLIQAIVDLMKNDFVLCKSVEGTRYQIILRETWEKIPESSKILVAGKRDWSIFSKLFNIEDFGSLKMIINDEIFREKFSKRNSFISCVKSLFVSLKSERKIELVEKFVSEIGIDEDERLKLRANFSHSCI